MGSTLLKNRQSDQHSLCIWMQAGVVDSMFCETDYDCPACEFDRTMQRSADKNKKKVGVRGKIPKGNPKRNEDKIVAWQDKLKKLPQWKRPCLHHMKGRIEFRACTNEYSCGNCDFDQFFQDQYTVHAVVKPISVLDVRGFKIPHGYYLHHGHAWVKMEESSTVRVGFDDFALRIVGPLDRIEGPLMGMEVKQNCSDMLIYRGQNVAKVLSPVSGVVTDINPILREKGSLANKDPYSEGWVLRINSKSLREDLKNLMMGDETEDFLSKEVDQLYQVIEEETGPLTVDGGDIGDDVYGNMPRIGWKRLTGIFLRT